MAITMNAYFFKSISPINGIKRPKAFGESPVKSASSVVCQQDTVLTFTSKNQAGAKSEIAVFVRGTTTVQYKR